MTISFNWIFGFAVGFEYVPYFDEESHVALDFGIFRLTFSWSIDDGEEVEV
jgi:hypothetical protein